MQGLVGKFHEFEDGNRIEVIQIKTRDYNIDWVTFVVTEPGALPRKGIMPIDEFLEQFGHLFEG
jgi:hypothetical protein